MPSWPPSRPMPLCLTPPNGAAGSRDQAAVEADHAGLEPLADPQAAGEVAGVDVGDQAVLGVVGQPDRLVLVGEGDDRGDRAEDLLAEDRRRRRARRAARSAGSRSRARSGRRAADDDARRRRRRRRRPARRPCRGVLVDQRADLGVRRRCPDRRAAPPSARPAGGRTRRRRRRCDVEPVRGGARLAAVAHLRDHRAVDGGVEVGVGEDEERRVAAELHRAVDDLVGGLAAAAPGRPRSSR